MRILATYYEIDAVADGARALEIDVSKEKGIWAVSRLLMGGQAEEIRFTGDSEEAIGVVRMLVRAGNIRNQTGAAKRTLKFPGDESYPRIHPFVHICPDPDMERFR